MKKTLDTSHITPGLRPLAVDITTLTFDPVNARLHDERNIEAIKASLKKYGQRKPLVVQKDGKSGSLIVRAGNGTLAGAKALGWKSVAVNVIEEDDITAMGYAIADNKTGDLSDWDEGVLFQNMEALTNNGLSLEDLGFNAKEYEKLEAKILGDIEKAGEVALDSTEYLVVVKLADEDGQRQLFEELKERGLECRLMS